MLETLCCPSRAHRRRCSCTAPLSQGLGRASEMGRAEAGLQCKPQVGRWERTVGGVPWILLPISDWLPTAPCFPSVLWFGGNGTGQSAL